MIARIWRRLRGTRQTPERVALAVALGAFIGCLPTYGLHFVLCLLVCLPFGLDLVLAYLVANISNPLLAPFLVTLEVELGSLLLNGEHAAFSLQRARATGILGFAAQAALGSVLVGSTLALLGGASAYFVARRARRQSEALHSAQSVEARLDDALDRTLARYATARVADRSHVAGKLRWDPLTELLAELPTGLGRVLDAGAGRGQFGLLLLELGACDALSGFDADAHKVAVATRAAAGAAVFEIRDLLDLPDAHFDTLLLFDVLHYLPLPEQQQLLEKASRCVPRGQILIRDLDAASNAQSAFTRAAEWLARVLGVHRGRAGRHYRPAAETVAALRELGFQCVIQGASRGTPFANVLIIAERSPAPARGSLTG